MEQLDVEQKEILNMGRDLTPAEHHFFLGSSTDYNGTVVNTDSLPQLLEDPKFLTYFLTPMGINGAPTEEQISALNRRRSQGLVPQFPLFIPHERWREFVNFKLKIGLPSYNPQEKGTAREWPVDVYNAQGGVVDLRTTEDIVSTDPYLSVGIDKESNQLRAAFNEKPQMA